LVIGFNYLARPVPIKAGMRQPLFHPVIAAEFAPDVQPPYVVAVAVDKRFPVRLSVRIAHMWHDTLTTFAGRSELILCAVLLFAAAGACWILLLDDRTPPILRLAAGCAGLLVLTLAQGAIAWVGLHGSRGARLRVRRVLCAVAARWPSLAVGSLLYGALAGVGAGGLDAVLDNADINGPARPPLQPALAAAHDEVIRNVLVQSARLTINPLPALMWERAARSESERHLIPCDAAVLKAYPFIAAHCESAALRPAGLAEVGALLLLVMAEILLRFRMVMALQPNRARTGGRLRGPMAWVRPSLESARVALRHLLVVVMHVWLLLSPSRLRAGCSSCCRI
jgi:hypothetical protein